MRNWLVILFLLLVLAALAYFGVLMFAPPGGNQANRNANAGPSSGNPDGPDTDPGDGGPDSPVDHTPDRNPDPDTGTDPTPDPDPDPEPEPGPQRRFCEGRVVDPDGNPVPGAALVWFPQLPQMADGQAAGAAAQMVEQFASVSGMRAPDDYGPGYFRADEDGHFRFEWRPGLIEAGAMFTGDTRDLPPTAPGVLAAASPRHRVTTLDVEWGETGPLTITIEAVPGIELLVTDADSGDPVNQATVINWSSAQPEAEADYSDPAVLMNLQQRIWQATGDNQPQQSVTDETGRLFLRTREGRHYHVLVRSQRHLHAWQVNIAAPASGVEQVAIALDPGRSMDGRVIDQDGHGVPNATVSMTDANIGWQFGDLAFVNATTDIDGAFTIAGLPDKPEMIVLAQIAAQGYEPRRMNLPAGERGPLTITLQRLGVIRGRVQDAEGNVLTPPTVMVQALGDSDGDEFSGRWGPGRMVAASVEWYWVNEGGAAVNPDGEPDDRYEQPNSWQVGATADVQWGGMGPAAEPTVVEHSGMIRIPEGPPGAHLAFRAIGLRDGQWTLTASGSEYSPASSGPHEIANRNVVRDVIITLKTGAVLEGTVTGPDGSPVANAWVWVGEPVSVNLDGVTPDSPADQIPDPPTPAWERSATTDGNGHYRIPALPGGEAMVTVAGPAFAPNESRLVLPETGTVTHDVALAEGMTITGRVVLADGTPAADAWVSCQVGEQRDWNDLRGGGGQNWQSWQKYQQAVAWRNQRVGNSVSVEVDNETGAFVVRGLVPGRYSITGGAEGGIDAMVNASAGDTDVVVELGAVGRIVGTVRLPDGGIPSSGTIAMLNPDTFDSQQYPFGSSGSDTGDGMAGEADQPAFPGMPVFRGASGTGFQWDPGTGEFVIADVAGGRYTLTATSEGYAAARADNVTVSGGNDTRVDLVLAEPYRLEVRVVDANGLAVADASVRIEPRQETGNPWMSRGTGPMQSGTTDSGGLVVFEMVTTPLVNVIASAPELSTVTVPVDVRVETAVEVTLSRGGVIEGLVRSREGRPMPDTMVMAMNQAAGEQRSTQTDASGNYRFDGLAAGRWIVMVQALQTEENQMPAFRMVAVKAGETVTADFGGAGPMKVAVSGQVTRGGDPVEGMIGFFRPGSEMVQRQARTDATGYYEIELPPGDYLVFNQGGGNGTQRVRVSVPEAPTARIDIRLPAATVSGRVTDTAGQPVAGVRVELSRSVRGAATDPLQAIEQAIPVGQAQTGPDGRYTIEGVTPGTFDVWVRTGMMGAGVTTANGEPVAITHGGTVTVADGGQATRDVTVAVAGSLVVKLEGFARETLAESELDIRDSSGRRVPVHDPQFGQPPLTGPTTTFSNLAAGTYSVRVHVPGSAWAEQTVTVYAGDTTEAVFTATPGATVTVILESSAGPVAVDGWSLQDATGRDITPRGNIMDLMTGDTSGLAEGRLEIADLAPGSYTLEVVPAGRDPVRRRFTVTGDQPMEIRLPLD